jgi:hypothetical protein
MPGTGLVPGMATKTEICRYWNTNPPSGGWLADGEAAIRVCFACGREGTTEVHHIRPVAVDDVGLDEMAKKNRREARLMADPSLEMTPNLHLLCRGCHREAPHTPDTDIYWAWFNGVKSHLQKVLDLAPAVAKELKLTSYEMEMIDWSQMPSQIKRLKFYHPGNDEFVVARAAVTRMVLDLRNNHPGFPGWFHFAGRNSPTA